MVTKPKGDLKMEKLIKVLKNEMTSDELVELLETGRLVQECTDDKMGCEWIVQEDGIYRSQFDEKGDWWNPNQLWQPFQSGDLRCEDCGKLLGYLYMPLGRVEIQCPRCKTLNVF